MGNASDYPSEDSKFNSWLAQWDKCSLGLHGGSDGKESACNVGDLGSIPRSEDPLEEGMATHSSILAWRIPTDRGAWWATVRGVANRHD